MLLHRHRTAAGTAPAVRRRKGFVQVDMHHVHAEIARTGNAHQRIHVGAIHIKEGALAVQEFGRLDDARFEHTQRIGIGNHQSGDVFVHGLFERAQIEQTVFVGADVFDHVAGNGSGGGVGAVRRIRYQNLLTRIALLLEQRAADRWTFDYDRPLSIGKVKAFYGNVGVLVRALAYILAHGGPGLRNATVDAVLNANYIRHKLRPYFDLPYDRPNMHEVVFSDDRQAAKGVRTGDIAKRLIDYGFHPYTVSFPLIVHGALMIEPTETESKREIDLFVDAMISIAKEVEEDTETVLKAPHSTRTTRVDEVTAARKPIVRWQG